MAHGRTAILIKFDNQTNTTNWIKIVSNFLRKKQE